jgi:hypothetical protein
VSGNGLGGGVGNGSQVGSSVTLNRCVECGYSSVYLIDVDCVRHTVYLLLFVTAAALVLSVAYLILARIFTRALMHITLVLSIILNM